MMTYESDRLSKLSQEKQHHKSQKEKNTLKYFHINPSKGGAFDVSEHRKPPN